MRVGKSIRFNYTGGIQKIELPPGKYKLEVWGAEGGGRRLSGDYNSGLGGLGGYSAGILTLKQETILYIYVGGYGQSPGRYGVAKGGWNGGGNGHYYAWNEPGNGGGGGTDIRLNSSLYSRIIVAGGGGGGGEDTNDLYGHGGGITGTPRYYPGTQTSAGTGGGFGYGGSTKVGTGGGGGGGWYGGGTTSTHQDNHNTNGGGGGSGYVYTEESSINYPSGCLLNKFFYLTDTILTTGVNTGHGYAIITCLQILNIYKNSNIYKNTIQQEYFDFNKLLEV